MSTPNFIGQQSGEGRARPALVPLRAVVLVASGLVVLAASQLFFLHGGTDPPGGLALGSWLRLVASVEALAMSGAGVSLFFAPSWIARAWPWTLTTLTSRSIGAWFLGIAVLAWAVPLENDLDRARWVFV